MSAPPSADMMDFVPSTPSLVQNDQLLSRTAHSHDANSSTGDHVHYIKEEDLKSICYREFFVEGSCTRNPCVFQHEFPRELRVNETITNMIKKRQAVIKRRRINRF